MDQIISYFYKLITETKPMLASAWLAIVWCIFPNEAYEKSAYAVIICMVIDIATKYIALSVQSGSFIKALKHRRINSAAMWSGTSIKIYSYLVVAIMVGLSYRVVMLEQLGVFIGTVVYAILFLRESQSIVENLIDAGADLKWLLVWTKKKEQQILENEIDEKPKEDSGSI